MGFVNLCCRRSAARLASSVCGGRVRSISTVVNRPSLVHNPAALRPFVSRGFLYSTAAIDDDWVSSEQAVLRELDSEYNDPVDLNRKDVKDRSKGMRTLPASFPFKIEDIPGSRTVTFTREYNGQHIKVVASMHLRHDDGGRSFKSAIADVFPLVVTVTKKSGRSLELRCRVRLDKITIDDIHVILPGHSSEDPKVIWDMDDIVRMNSHESLKETFNKYLAIRGLDASTISTMDRYMLDKMRLEYWLWLDNVKEFLEE